MSNSNYWAALDQLLADSEIVIDRPKNSAHPRYPEWIYPLDYGYLQNTSSMDGEGLDVWLGSDPTRRITAILCTVDLIKRDSEIKLLIGCTEEEKNIVLRFHNRSESMKGLLVEGCSFRLLLHANYGMMCSSPSSQSISGLKPGQTIGPRLFSWG